jgi:hypothetical protein
MDPAVVVHGKGDDDTAVVDQCGKPVRPVLVNLDKRLQHDGVPSPFDEQQGQSVRAETYGHATGRGKE